GLARDFGAAVKAPHEVAVARAEAVQGAIVRAKVNDVERRIVQGFALHGPERLKAPDGAPVVRSERVQAMVARADEDAATRRIDLGLATLVGLSGCAGGGGELFLKEHAHRPRRAVQ